MQLARLTMRQLCAFILFLLGASCATADEIPAAPNCEVMSPPPGTKGKGTHQGIFFGYPKDLPPGYTGCLHLWIAGEKDGQDWELRMTTYYVNGEPRAYLERIRESGEGQGEVTLECRYKKRMLVFQNLHQDGSASHQCPESSTLDSALRGQPAQQTR